MWMIDPECDGIEAWVSQVREAGAAHMEINAAFGGSTDLDPIVSAIAAVGLPSLTSLGIHLEFDEAEYPLGDLPTLLAALPALEELEARGSLESIVGLSTLRTLKLQLTPLSESALASFEAASWPALESLSLQNDGRPFPEAFDVYQDAARVNDLEWPQKPLPKLTAARFPKLKELELDTGGDAYDALQNLFAEPAVLANLTTLRFSAGYISKTCAGLLLRHSTLFVGIDEVEIEGTVGWGITSATGDAIQTLIPQLVGMTVNDAIVVNAPPPSEDEASAASAAAPTTGEADDGGQNDEEFSDNDTPEYRALIAFPGPFCWFMDTEGLELSVSTQAAIARYSPAAAPGIGEIGQISRARLLGEFGWTMQNVLELKEVLSHFGIVLGAPLSEWNLERGREIG